MTAALAEKVAHVRAARSTGNHTCHWPGCDKMVAPAAWGCHRHWFRLPRVLRDRVWDAYRPGQESPEYLAAASAVQTWIATTGGAA